MIDVTSKLESFIAGKVGWQMEQGKELALAIARQFHGSLDWDEDAGEDWARVLADDKVTALVCMTGPLVIVVGGATAESLEEPDDLGKAVPVIKVPEFDAVVLRCDADILHIAFGDLATPALDPNAFSASDLWFSTV
jgi:hypothetical protein